MKKILTLTLGLLSLMATAQWGDKKIRGNGNVVTIERSVGDYETIASAGWFDIMLVSGTEGQITLKGEDRTNKNNQTSNRKNNNVYVGL